MAVDYTTDVGAVRLLADDDGASPVFSDAQVQAALTISDGSVYLAAALLLDKKANSLTASSAVSGAGTSVRIGDYSQSSITSSLAAIYAKAADDLRNLEYNTPALAIIEEDFGEFSQLALIRNYILRNLS